MAQQKERLDKLMVDRGLVETRSKARGMIMAGEVLVDGRRQDKPGMAVPLDADITLITPMPYVGRGGYKLAGALDAFALDVDGRVCADVGASTGGFTDVLLQRGAARVYDIDVGQGVLDWKLRQDERVVLMERTNARYLESLPEPVTFVAIDVSFISLKLILPAVAKWLEPTADVVALIKPQFEAGPQQVKRGGIVREAAVRHQVLEDVLGWAQANGWQVAGLITSPIQGGDGNVEYLAWLRRGEGEQTAEIERMISQIIS